MLTIKHRVLKEKEIEIQKQLEVWARGSGLFSVGDSIMFSLKLTEAPVVLKVETSSRLPDLLPNTGYYSYFPMVPENYEEILALESLEEKWKRVVRVFQTHPGISLPRHTIEKQCQLGDRGLGLHGSRLTAALRKSRIKFRVARTRWDKKKGEMVQLFRAEPKGPSKKHWEG